MNDFRKLLRNWILGESQEPDVFSHIQMLYEIFKSFHPTTLREQRALSVAVSHLNEIRRHARKLQERIQMLEEDSKK